MTLEDEITSWFCKKNHIKRENLDKYHRYAIATTLKYAQEQVKNIAYEPVLAIVDFKAFEAGYKSYRALSGNTAPYDEAAQATCEIEFQKARNDSILNNR